MKFSGQTKDGAIENLLRAYVSRPGNPQQECPDFDSDRANAYIEQSLPNPVRLQYEAHLSGCSACRKGVVALLRMAGADSLTTVTPVRQISQTPWLSRAKEMFGALSQPQWAMAATAVIVLAVSVPLFLSREAGNASQPLANQSSSDKVASAESPASPAANTRLAEVPAPTTALSKQREDLADKSVTPAKDAPASPHPADPASGFVSPVELAKKTDAKNSTETLDEVQRKSESQAAPAQAGAAPGSQVAKGEADQNRQQQPAKDAAQQVAEPKLAARSNEERAKERSEQRAEDVAPPPSPRSASDDERGRSGFRRAGKLGLRDSGAAEAVRPEERKFNGKKFLFRDGAWTDKDFDPNKDQPVVTIIRDSNVYKEVLNKRPGLKPFLTGFLATDRAIIVYKGTVYKLIPQ